MMSVLVVYESMYGNTHTIAERIGDGLRQSGAAVSVLPVGAADGALVAAADLLVVGGPTHVHGVSRSTTRRNAVETAKNDSSLAVDPDAEGPGLRDWLPTLRPGECRTAAAAFDTRVAGPAPLTGRASKGIARRLRQQGYRLVVAPESFLVDKHNRLLDDEADRAHRWGAA